LIAKRPPMKTIYEIYRMNAEGPHPKLQWITGELSLDQAMTWKQTHPHFFIVPKYVPFD
jgi:hypothetical protein